MYIWIPLTLKEARCVQMVVRGFAHICVQLHVSIFPHTHKCTCTHTSTHTRTHTHAIMHKNTRTSMRAHKHTRIHQHTHVYVYAHFPRFHYRLTHLFFLIVNSLPFLRLLVGSLSQHSITSPLYMIYWWEGLICILPFHSTIFFLNSFTHSLFFVVRFRSTTLPARCICWIGGSASFSIFLWPAFLWELWWRCTYTAITLASSWL